MKGLVEEESYGYSFINEIVSNRETKRDIVDHSSFKYSKKEKNIGSSLTFEGCQRLDNFPIYRAIEKLFLL